MSEIEAAEKDGELLRSLTDIRSAEQDDPDGTLTDSAYAEAFRHRGLDLDRLAPTAAAEAIRARPASVAVAPSIALMSWPAVGAVRNETAEATPVVALVNVKRLLTLSHRHVALPVRLALAVIAAATALRLAHGPASPVTWMIGRASTVTENPPATTAFQAVINCSVWLSGRPTSWPAASRRS